MDIEVEGRETHGDTWRHMEQCSLPLFCSMVTDISKRTANASMTLKRTDRIIRMDDDRDDEDYMGKPNADPLRPFPSLPKSPKP